MRVYNTLSGKIEDFSPLKEGEVRMYTCGPTVYDYAHIGNFRSYVFEDFVRRTFKYLGYKVIQVMNITDVDDKTIKRSREEGVSLQEYTQKYTEEFFKDIDTLNIERAEYYPKATEHIEDMVKIIKGLLEKGIAYKTEDGIYYDISKFPEYGKLSKIDKSSLRKGVRINVDEYDKENVHDFALWKFRREGEPFWKTEIGEGRPGWHIECSAMSMKYLGETFDIHMGGVDNIFPHHENEIAQSEAYTGKKFVNYWIHVHHLIVNGEKMSKSKGNFYTLRDLLKMGYNPLHIRYLLLSTHYRRTLNFTFESLEKAKKEWMRIYNFMVELETTRFKKKEGENIENLIEKYRGEFKSAISDDFNVSRMFSVIFEFIKEGNKLVNSGKVGEDEAKKLIKAIRDFDRVLGVLPDAIVKPLPQELKQLVEQREKLRKEKNYKEADKIREILKERGVILEDTPWGTRWKLIE